MTTNWSTAVGQYFKMGPGALSSVDALADEYRRHNTAAVVFTIDARTGMRHVPNSVEDLVAGAIRNNDVLIPFGSVDPWHERRAVHRVHELVRDYGVKGFKFHPSMQAFEPNDRRFYPIYEAIAEAGVPALFHTGQTGIGAGLPGGHRIKLRYSDPMLLDDVAADFPELTIVMAHPAVPWVDSQIAIATHKANVYIDLSGWSPKYFPPQLVRAASRQLRTKVLFGTDYPYIKMDRWRRDFEALDIDPAVVPLIFKDNALRVLGYVLSASRRKCPTRREKGTFASARRKGAMSFPGGRSVSVTDPAPSRRPSCLSAAAPRWAPRPGLTCSTSDLDRCPAVLRRGVRLDVRVGRPRVRRLRQRVQGRQAGGRPDAQRSAVEQPRRLDHVPAHRRHQRHHRQGHRRRRR